MKKNIIFVIAFALTITLFNCKKETTTETKEVKTTGTLKGKVTDSISGNPIADVFITTRPASGTFDLLTNATGDYQINGITKGTYTVIASKTGYYTDSVVNVNIKASETTTANIKLTSTLPTHGLVAYYPFNGNANDESGNGWNGTVNGTIPTQNRFGISNTAYHFDSTSSNTITTQFSGVLGSHSRTISFWQTSDNISRSISMSYGAGTNYQSTPGCTFVMFAQRISSNQVIAGVDLRFGGIAYLISDSGSGWHHYTIVVPDIAQPRTQDVKLYRDGTLVTTVYSMFGDVAVNTLDSFNFIIGQFVNSANFGGNLDDIRIYNRALSDSEIQALYHEGGW
ncbi:MAG: carboxypeptidase regulatory-like domain-containing protein [Ignavibacteriales bacterium]|nr:carboxypeptidase regulatory-like domain-containing protein [Ignavibacteriales bacterium]